MYDELGRLTGVIDPASDAVTYAYDAVGNLLSISRRPSSQVSIIEFTPNSGPVGTTVTIFGTSFSTTPAQNTVKFNGVTTTVTSATKTQLIAAVPTGATTGPISVTAPGGTATSGTPFTVTASKAPTISNFSPTIGVSGTAVSITGTNFETQPTNNRTVFNVVTSPVNTSTATNISTSVPVAASGKISVTTPFGKATSTADFIVPPPPFTAADVATSTRMSIGQSKSITIGTANKIGLILFDGTAGQRISLKPSAVTIYESYISILKPDGTTLVPATYVNAPGSFFIDTTLLPMTGTYTILVDPYSTYTGNMTVTLYSVPPDVSTTIVAGGSAVTVTTTTPGQNARLTFSGSAGQRVSLNITSVTIYESYVSILKPDGTTLVSPIYMTSSGRFIDTTSLPTTGTYTILVDPYAANTGSATLRLYNVPNDVTATMTIGGAAVSVTTTVPGQNARVTFSGTATQRINLTVSNVTITESYISILKPDGSTLVSPTYFGIGGGTIGPTTLPVTGTYTVFVDPYAAYTGSMTLRVTLAP
jgi:YD repeat-containing protein